jgi:heme-degrading monooxygenase HmoA
MVLEHAIITTSPGQGDAFEAVLPDALAVIRRAEGIGSVEIHRGIESPDTFLLLVEWDTLEAHTVGFRESALFAEWRGVIGSFFASPPQVEHFTLILPD